MTSTFNKPFPPVAPAAIASYDYVDIAAGTGVIKFYGASHYEAGAESYQLTTNPLTSNLVVANGTTTITADTSALIVSNNHDVIFNKPQDIKGYAYLNINCGGKGGTVGLGNFSVYVSGAKLQRVSSGTPTDLCTEVKSGAISPWNDYGYKFYNIQMDLTGGPYHFQEGDTLRLVLPVWGTAAGEAGNYGGYGQDPQNRTDPLAGVQANATFSGASINAPTKMELYVPFVVDVGQ